MLSKQDKQKSRPHPPIPPLQALRLFPDFLRNLPASLHFHPRGFAHGQQLLHAGVFAVAIHRGGMLAIIGGTPGEVIGGRRVPAVLCRVVQPAEILGVVVPVVGENVEAHAPVHLRRILGIAPGKDARELDSQYRLPE